MCLKLQSGQLQVVGVFLMIKFGFFFFYDTLAQFLNFKGFMKLLSRAENETQYLQLGVAAHTGII